MLAIDVIIAVAGDFVTGCHARREVIEAANGARSAVGFGQTEGGVIGGGNPLALEDAATQIERGAGLIIEGERDYRMSEAEGHDMTTDESSRKLKESLTS